MIQNDKLDKSFAKIDRSICDNTNEGIVFHLHIFSGKHSLPILNAIYVCKGTTDQQINGIININDAEKMPL